MCILYFYYLLAIRIIRTGLSMLVCAYASVGVSKFWTRTRDMTTNAEIMRKTILIDQMHISTYLRLSNSDLHKEPYYVEEAIMHMS